MGRSIVKIRDRDQDWYLEWSSVVDAPVTYGMTLDELKAHTKEQYGQQGLDVLPERLARVEATGTSSMMGDRSVEEFIRGNRAGKGETCLTLAQIGEMYCRGEDAPEIEGTKPWEDKSEQYGNG